TPPIPWGADEHECRPRLAPCAAVEPATAERRPVDAKRAGGGVVHRLDSQPMEGPPSLPPSPLLIVNGALVLRRPPIQDGHPMTVRVPNLPEPQQTCSK